MHQPVMSLVHEQSAVEHNAKLLADVLRWWKLGHKYRALGTTWQMIANFVRGAAAYADAFGHEDVLDDLQTLFQVALEHHFEIMEHGIPMAEHLKARQLFAQEYAKEFGLKGDKRPSVLVVAPAGHA